MKYFFKYLIVAILTIATFSSCSVQKRLNRKQKKVEQFARKHGLTTIDTIHIIDTITVTTPYVKHDTIFKQSTVRDTLIIRKEESTVKYYYDHTTDSVYIEAECDSVPQDTIINISRPVEKITITEKEDFDWWKTLNILILLAIGYIILSRKRIR